MYTNSNRFILFFSALLMILSMQVLSQEAFMLDMTNTITKEELKEYVYALADDSMEGRFTCSPGQKMAAGYLSKYLSDNGLHAFGEENEYKQSFKLEECNWIVGELSLRQEVYSFPHDFLILNDPLEGRGTADLIYGGFGLDHQNYSDLENLDVKGKIILAFAGEPKDKKGIYRVSKEEEPSRDSYYFRKFRKAKELGAVGMILIGQNSKDFKKYYKQYFANKDRESLSYPDDRDTSSFFGLYTTARIAANLLGTEEKTLLKSAYDIERIGESKIIGMTDNIRYNFNQQCSNKTTENIVGFIPGTDLKDEWIVVVAHYDHLGKSGKKIYNGADDNASGTAAVMEIAETFAKASVNGFKARRSVAFLMVSAEEIGLYGSRYFTENCPFDLDKTYAVVNIDMIGGVGSKFDDNKDYIYGWGYVSEDIVDVAAENSSLLAPSLDFKMTYSNRRGGGSDHYYFVRNDIPSLFYFTGIHKRYHTPDDTPDRLLYDRMEKTTRAIFGTVWSLANREEPLKQED